MSGKRKGISQREAMRNRRELRKLRAFVEAIRGDGRSDYHAHVVTIPGDSDKWAMKLSAMQWGASYRLVALADFCDPTKARITVIRVPEPRP